MHRRKDWVNNAARQWRRQIDSGNGIWSCSRDAQKPVLSENSFLRKRLKIASDDARREAHKASSLRRDRLERYMRENELRKVRRSLSEVALGCLALGVALGSAIMSIALAILMKG